jgi:hypothetical protein
VDGHVFAVNRGYERKPYVSMRCITKFMRGKKYDGVYLVDEGCEGYVDGLKGATIVE